MITLRATVRLQLQRDFDLAAAAAQVPYLAALGISHLYLSPIGTAREGSMHGYDVVDPTRVSAELGGEDALRRLVAALRAHDMGVIVDIVPNHMAADTANPWWRDVLARGRQSSFARYFDIDWEAPRAAGRLILPVLDGSAAQATSAHQLRLVCRVPNAIGADAPRTPPDEPVVLLHGEQPLPLSAASLRALLAECGVAGDGLRSRPAVVAACARLLDSGAGGALADAATRINATALSLQRVLDLQHFELVDWREANARINYRRFFDINGLAALAMERRQVFAAVHALPLRLIAEGLVDGLRIDHVDGLSAPGTYLRTLRKAVDRAARRRPPSLRGHVSIHVEKILAADEPLRSDWPVDGSTGYDFMAQVGALAHDMAGAAPLRAAWAQLAATPADFERVERAARAGVLAHSLTPEWSRCARAFSALADAAGSPPQVDEPALRGAIGQVLQSLRVYRSYLADATPVRDTAALTDAFALAQARAGDAFASAREALRSALLAADELGNPARHLAIRRFEQTAAALNAKAVEDTAFYRYGVLLSRNEVGSDPRCFALSAQDFHAAMTQRVQHAPLSLLATATHDHKRGEDTRARLAVLASRADDYVDHAIAWLRQLRAVDATPAPTDIWMLLQTVVAAWPLGLAADARGNFDRVAMREFAQRIDDWQRKALREAGQRTRWTRPEPDYEAACQRVTHALLLDRHRATLRAQVGAWAHSLDAAGAMTGLVAVTLRCTVPGVPDLYQGTEWWDQSLVDPDNRRPVDWSARADALAEAASPDELLRDFRDGRIKQFVIRRLLALRREHPALFARGDFTALQLTGDAPVLAFLRQQGSDCLLVVVPLTRSGTLPADGGEPDPATLPLPAASAMAAASVVLPESLAAVAWQDIFTLTRHRAGNNALALQPLLGRWPVAVLHATRTSPREAS